MNVDINILLFFSAFATINGMFLSFYFIFFTKNKHISNQFLGGLFLLLSLRVGKSVLIYINPYLAGFYLQLGIFVCFFFGPFLYFYIVSIFNPEKNNRRNWINHMLILLTVAIISGLLFPSIENRTLWKNYFINVVFLIWLLYIIKSSYLIKSFITRRSKKNDFKSWLLILYFGNLLIWFTHITSRFTSYISISITISVFIYSLLIFLVFTKHKNNLFTIDRIRNQIFSTSKVDDILILRLKRLMLDEELFKNPKLKSSDVAKKLNIPAYKLSEIINESLNMNFSNYVNEYRIELAKKLLNFKDEYTIEAIGQVCGFNSKSSFYSAFKKFTGSTPSNFI